MTRKDLRLLAGSVLFLVLVLSAMFFTLIEAGCFDPIVRR
jgi:hypothetical protein